MNTRFHEQPGTPECCDLSRRQARSQHSPASRISRCVVILTVLLLVSFLTATFALFPTRRVAYASGGAPTPTPSSTPLPGQLVPGLVYAASPGSLTLIDLKTNRTLWTIQANNPTAPLVMGSRLFFDDESMIPSLEAVNAKDGTLLWSSRNYPNGFLLGSGNMLYDSACDPFATTDPCHIYGINASTGSQVWSYDLPQGTGWITLQNGVLYGVSYTSYFALNPSTGIPLWQKDLLAYQDQEANMAPVIHGNVLSFASCNTTKQSSGFPGCYLYAFNAYTGQELWHMSTTRSLQIPPAIMDGVVYACAVDGTLYALNELNGGQLWIDSVHGTPGQILARAGTVYIETVDPGYPILQMEAFDAATHTLSWGPTSASMQSVGATRSLPLAVQAPKSAGLAVYTFVLEHGLIYMQDGANFITVLKSSDGNVVVQYVVSSARLNGITFVV